MPENDVDLAAYGILDIRMSERSALDIADAMVKVRDERIEKLLAVIARADDFLNKQGDMIAAHITLWEALHPDE